MQLNELIDKLQAATEGSEALDAEITAYINNAIVRPYPPSNDFGLHDHWQFWSRDGEHFLGSEGRRFKVAPVTRSFDAALALMKSKLPGLEFGLYVTTTQAKANFNRNKVDVASGEAATAPLAMCAALLRALYRMYLPLEKEEADHG